MNGNSKAERVESFIRRMVRQAAADMAFDCPDKAEFLRKNHTYLAIYIENRITETYRFQELKDIMAWKRPPKERE